MNNISLAQSYLKKAQVRLKIIELLIQEKAYSDVIRESQEAVELSLKGILRQIGVDPPKQHDVGWLLREYKDKLPVINDKQLERIIKISKWLRKEREFSFYGDVDFIPSLEYSLEDAKKAQDDLKFVVEIAEEIISPVEE